MKNIRNANSFFYSFFICCFLLITFTNCGNSSSSNSSSELDAIYREIDKSYDATISTLNLPPDSPIVKNMERKCRNHDRKSCDWLVRYRKNAALQMEKDILRMKQN